LRAGVYPYLTGRALLNLTLVVGRRFAENVTLTMTQPHRHAWEGAGKVIVRRSMSAPGLVTSEGHHSDHG
jgi:hypothetical protein